MTDELEAAIICEASAVARPELESFCGDGPQAEHLAQQGFRRARPLGAGVIEIRSRHRRRRGHVAIVTVALVVVALVGLVALVRSPPGRQTPATGPSAARPIPVKSGRGTATTEVSLLDGTRLRLTLPSGKGRTLAGLTFQAPEFHGSVGEVGHGCRVDVALGTLSTLVHGDSAPLPAGAAAPAAVIDQAGRRLGLQFGAWAVVASGDTMSDADVQTLVTGVALVEGPDGFVRYTGSLRLGIVDAADVLIRGTGQSVSVFLRECAPVATRNTPAGLTTWRIANGPGGRRIRRASGVPPADR